MRHCLFIAKHNVFVLCLNDKAKRTSKLELYAFKSTGVVRDSYVIKSRVPDIDQPILPRSYSFSGCLGSRSSLTQREELKDDIDENYKNIQNTEKLLEYLFDNPIKSLSFCDELNLLSIGFRDGNIQSFFVHITVEKNDDEGADSDEEHYNRY